MNPEHEEHLAGIVQEASLRISSKYRKGQARHGGALWEFCPHALLEEAINEAVDQLVYLLTLREALSDRASHNAQVNK